jgi:uncharacterized protein
MSSSFQTAALVACALSLAATFASAASAEPAAPPRTITVQASGQVEAIPDVAHVRSGVVTEAETAHAALARNSATMKKLIDGLKAAGIEAKDIQTSAIRVEPRYTKARNARPAIIAGYRVSNQIELTARDLDRLGEVLDRLAGMGANEMNGLSFAVSEAETLKDKARVAAVANARRRAELIAKAAGAEVGDVISISENVSHGPRYGGARTARMAAAAPVPVERGSETLTASATVTWTLK